MSPAKEDMKRLQSKLEKVGAELHGFGKGVNCYYEPIPGQPKVYLTFDKDEWEFVEKIIDELLELRSEKEKK